MDFKTIILHTFTGVDNTTIDVGRILWVAGGLAFLGCAAYALYKGQAWDAVAFGTGFGLILAGGGGALMMKKGTEPSARDGDKH